MPTMTMSGLDSPRKTINHTLAFHYDANTPATTTKDCREICRDGAETDCRPRRHRVGNNKRAIVRIVTAALIGASISHFCRLEAPKVLSLTMGIKNFISKVFHSGEIPANEPVSGDEVNPPIWPNDDVNAVKIIGMDTPQEEIQHILDTYQDPYDEEAKAFRTNNHFTDRRTAIFFEKGTYKFDLQVGYYVQVAGLGASTSDVIFTDTKYGPYCPAYNRDKDYGGTSLDTFWRSAENFLSDTSEGLLWAVSQAAPIRRVHAKNNVLLFDGAAYASGGHIANAQIDGELMFGGQQQFCTRSVNISLDEATGVPRVRTGAWSNVFIDCVNSPPATNADHDPADGASVTINIPRITVEKPFIVMDDADPNNKKFILHVPKPRLRELGSDVALGADLHGESDEKRPFERVYVAKAKLSDYGDIDYDVARKINKALLQGKDVVLSPGMYHLNTPLQMKRADQVLLGLGMATLVAPQDGNPCIQVASNTPGVRVAGIMFEASHIPEPEARTKVASFIEWGTEGITGDQDPGDPANPGLMSDVFCRVGGSSLDRQVSTDVMVRIHSGNVLGDNLWLWRADHVALGEHELPNFPPLDYHQIVQGEVPVKTGLEVNGDDVTIHGLAVEHTTEHQVIWNGENGEVQFYQCELPYDVDSDFGLNNYLGFKVDRKIRKHSLGGAGVYSNFRDHDVLVKTAIEHPNVFDFDSKLVLNPFTFHLDNQGLIMTVVSDGKQKGGGPARPNSGVSKFPSANKL